MTDADARPALSITTLLDSIKNCSACGLMKENNAADIRYVPIKPKPNAKFMFIGRDPSPRTAQIVGVRGGRSVFINEIFEIADRAGVPEDGIYITDVCKCHWRTSVGVPWPGTEGRSSKLDKTIARTCMEKWLVEEIRILKPRLVVAFGEELYQLLRPYIISPNPPPKKLSAKADKSVLDAERWFEENGAMTLRMGDIALPCAFLRHAGNSTRLPNSTGTDKRRQCYEACVRQVISLLQNGAS